MELTKRALGCMYGQVIGDSLGSRYEFQPASVVQQMINEDSVQSFLPIMGGGPLQLLPGQVYPFCLITIIIIVIITTLLLSVLLLVLLIIIISFVLLENYYNRIEM